MNQEPSPWHNLTPEQRAQFLPNQIRPEDVQLSNKEPLYHAFVKTTESGQVTNAHEARARLARIAEAKPKVIAACQGKTAEEARRILEEAERTIN